VNQKGISVAFLADAGHGAVAGMDDGIVGQLHEFAANRVGNLIHRAAPEVGASNAAGEESVACKKPRHRYGYAAHIFRKVKAYASRSMTGRMHDAGLERAPTERVALFQKLVHIGDFRRRDAEESGLHIHPLIERKVIAMHQNGSAGVLPKLAEAADVINVGMRADDGFNGQAVAAEKFEDAGDFVAGVDDESFAAGRVADDGAITLQHSYGNGDVDEALGYGVECRNGVVHKAHYNIPSR